MADSINDTSVRPSTGKKRIPKACSSCRHSKVRCDELRPSCSRCQNLEKVCEYAEKPKTAEELRIEVLEDEVASLRQQLLSHKQDSSKYVQPTNLAPTQTPQDTLTSPHSFQSVTHSSPSINDERPLKRKRSHFTLRETAPIPDFLTLGALSEEEAVHYFACFFGGCDRYVPIFDASDDFTSIRVRSALLFNTICTIGCGVSPDTSIDNRPLQFQLKRWLTSVVLNYRMQSIETVQALLVMACWMPERSLILAAATRMAVELGMSEDFDRLVNSSFGGRPATNEHALMKRARTWFGLIILEQILQIDAGVLLGLKVKGVRRCRVLLDRPFSTCLDMRLFSQVELNHLLTKINHSLNGEDVSEKVQHARVDIDIWFNDWKRIMESSPLTGPELPSLLVNLTVQRYWADAIVMCRAIRATGVQNIDLMPHDEKQILIMAKTSLQTHLDVILNDPQYLSNLKYAMEFVWAKCAFTFLHLVKLTRLLPENANPALLAQGRQLHAKLSQVCGHGSSKVYLRLLQLTIEKYALVESGAQSADLESFEPDEFIFEWDFPGLNLFSSQTGWDMLFDQFMLGDSLLMGMDV